MFAQPSPGQHFAPLPICVKMFHSQYYLGKAIPLQACTGPECSTKMGLPDFKTIDTWRWWSCQPLGATPIHIQSQSSQTFFTIVYRDAGRAKIKLDSCECRVPRMCEPQVRNLWLHVQGVSVIYHRVKSQWMRGVQQVDSAPHLDPAPGATRSTLRSSSD